MRVLILISAIFLLGNIVLYLLPTDIETSNLSYASDPEVNLDDIRFFKSEQSVLESPLAEGQGDGAAINVSTTSAALCFRIGPFLRETRVTTAKGRLAGESIGYELIERGSVEVIASRVYVGPFDGASEAVAAREKLTESGVNDHFHRRESDGTYIVSLGIYSKPVSAEVQQSKFREKNIAAQVREEKTLLPKNYWLELEQSTSKEKIDSLDEVDWGESSVSAGMQECQTSA